jgi:translocation and assembly module TamA
LALTACRRLSLPATLGVALVASLFGCAHDGPQASGKWVKSVQIEGNDAFSDGDLRDRLATRKTGWWPLATRRWFDPAAMDLDLKRIPAFYADNGYFDARVLKHEIKDRGDGSVDVIITVQENVPTKIEKVTFEGFPANVQRRGERMVRRWDLEPGDTVNYERYSVVKGRLQDRLKEDGYAYGKVAGEISIDRDKHKAWVKLDSTSGPPVRFGKTTVVGNGSIPAHALLHRVTWKEGDKYDPHDLGTTQGRLYAFGVFSSVRMELPETPREVADVQIQVSPGQLKELKLGAGFGVERQREEVRGRAEWTISNFLGGLRKLRIRVRPAYVVIPTVADIARHGPAAENDVRLTQPDIFGTHVSFHAMAGYDLGITEGFQFHGPRGQLGIDRPFFRDRMLGGLAWNLQYFDFFSINTDVFDETNTALGGGFKDPYRLAFLEEFVQIDLRDRPLDPTYGGFVMLRAEEGATYFASDFRYLKLTPEIRAYVPLGRRIVLAARALGGWMQPYGEDAFSPVTRRFALGGPSSHRGFSFGRLSPQIYSMSQDRSIPIGGDGQVLFSLESRIDIVRVGGNWLGIVPFVDAGDVTPDFDDLDLRELHLASGLSLEYQTPIGVIRGGVGVRLNRMGGNNPDPNDRLAFHITIGEAF